MPSAAPMIAASDSGESMTLSGPYLSKSLSVARNTPPRLPTSSPMTTTRSSRAISLSRVVAMAWAIVWTLILFLPPGRAPSPQELPALAHEARGDLGVDVVEHPLDRRGARRLGPRDRVLELGAELGARLLLGRVVPQVAALEEAAVARQRVAATPRLYLLARTVAGVVVGRGVAAVAVDDELDERRTDALAGALDGVAGHEVRGQHVHAVDEVPGHAVRLRLHGDVVGAGLLLEVDADGVAVVLAGEDDGRPLGPGEVHAGVPVALRRRAVAERAQHDLGAAGELHGQRGAHGGRHVRGDRRGDGEDVQLARAGVVRHLPGLRGVGPGPHHLPDELDQGHAERGEERDVAVVGVEPVVAATQSVRHAHLGGLVARAGRDEARLALTLKAAHPFVDEPPQEHVEVEAA